MKLTLLIQILSVLVPQIFSNDMILQQGRNVPVWGTAASGETITVTLVDEGSGATVAKVKGKADKEGAWRVELPSLKAEGQTLTLNIAGKKEKLVFTNIAVGEVWLCSGQSNMAYEMKRSWQAAPMKGEDLATLELEKPANPAIRVFIPGRGRPGRTPAPNANNGWKLASGESLPMVSAAGYFFAKNLSEALGVPVGIISSASGGSEIEQWMPGGNLYPSGIKALMPFAIGGFLWYQGESNLAHETPDYLEKYVAMTSDWREGFESPDAPFYSVLLAPHTFSDRLHRGHFVTSEALPEFWQTQLKAADTVENSKIICVSDLVDKVEDIHPSYKWIVGQRLANLALADKYKVEGAAEWSGPKAVSLRIDGNKAIVRFDHVAAGLKGRSNSVEPNSTPRIKWFEIAGADGIWHQAFADIVGTDEVAVTHPAVAKPVSVRFAWRETAQPNLFNSEDLPAFPFILSVDELDYYMQHVAILSSDEFGGRGPLTVHEGMTIQHIAAEMQQLGLQPGVDGSYLQGVELNTTMRPTGTPLKGTSHNVVGVIPGKTDEYVVVCAHWDHLGIDPSKEGDNIYNGASDNAVGVAGLLTLARRMMRQDPNPERGVIFVATTGEEEGLLGSKWFAEHPTVPADKIVAAVNIDGGAPLGKARNVEVYAAGMSTLDGIIEQLAKEEGRYASLFPKDKDSREIYRRTDAWSFIQAGIPSVHMCGGQDFVNPEQHASYPHQPYHDVDDELHDKWDMSGVLDQLDILYKYTIKLTEVDPRPRML